MRCSELNELIPLYGDSSLSEQEAASVETHVEDCEPCRQEVIEYRFITRDLGSLQMPPLPAALKDSLNGITNGSRQTVLESFSEKPAYSAKIRHWLMPFGGGAITTATFAFLFLSLISIRPGLGWLGIESNNRASNGSDVALPQEYPGTAGEPLRIEIPDTAPEVNPAGALVALTRSIVRGKMNDEEVVVVADVFGDGLANLREIVEAPSDDDALRELERAFRTRPEEAPFLPAKISKGSDAVRVVLKIQRVEVLR